MKTVLACFALLVLQVPQVASATAISTGEDLQRTCNVAEQFTRCTTYLKVVYDTVKAISKSDGSSLGKILGSCGPEKGIDTVPLVVALRIAWQEYAHKYPDRLHQLAVPEALRAFEEKWPCPQ